jgi:hypothetical protein
VSKWQRSVSKNCTCCDEIETTKHMIFECKGVETIWRDISLCLCCKIKWKNIVCGFTSSEFSDKIKLYNLIISIVCYILFKENSKCNFDDVPYNRVNLRMRIKQMMTHYRVLLQNVNYEIRFEMFDRILLNL